MDLSRHKSKPPALVESIITSSYFPNLTFCALPMSFSCDSFVAASVSLAILVFSSRRRFSPVLALRGGTVVRTLALNPINHRPHLPLSLPLLLCSPPSLALLILIAATIDSVARSVRAIIPVTLSVLQ